MGNSKSFVLRFRDIETDDTVKNHQDIIKKMVTLLVGLVEESGGKRSQQIH
jgi:hypothetical protein